MTVPQMCRVVVAVVLLAPTIARAQVIAGVTVDAAEHPVPGVVVQLLDSASAIAAQSLTTESGSFRVTARRAGTYRLRTLRIGYEPTTSAPLSLARGQNVTRRVTLTGIPFSLDTIRVAGRAVCRSIGSSSSATFAIWEQARAALTATQITANSRAVTARTVVYDRTLSPDAREIQEQSSRIYSGTVTQPWRSLSPDSLHEFGYVATDGNDWTTYYAPGLDALLASTFVEDHCFRIVASTSGSEVGLAFEPTSDRDKIAEIRGTLWVDRKTSELRSIDFRYTNISRSQEDGGAGGDMAFVRMSNGQWAISSWNIRMPLLEQSFSGGRVADVGLTAVAGIHVTGIQLTGGELALATAAARGGVDTLWSHPPLELTGTVLDSASGAATVDGTVSLRGTHSQTTTDSSGRFKIPGLLPGNYMIEVRTPSLDSLNVVHRRQLAFTDSSVVANIRLPSAYQITSTVCGTWRVTDAPGIVVGTVQTGAGSAPPANMRVVIEWTEHAGDAAPRQRAFAVRPDNYRGFRLCGAPLNTSIAVHIEVDSSSTAPTRILIPSNRLIATANLTLETLARTVAAFTGTVMADSTHRPIADAEIFFPDITRSVLTGQDGAFLVGDVPVGIHHVMVRHIGYAPLDTSLEFKRGTMDRTIYLSRAVLLDPVVSTANARLGAFEENRRVGLGHFLTRDDLAKMEGRSTASVLAQLPGAAVVGGRANFAWVASNRGPRSLTGTTIASGDEMDHKMGAPSACYAQVYVDKVHVYHSRPNEPLFNLNSISPDQIEAIEYYASPAQTPAIYSTLNSVCGVLVIHTRRFSAP